MIPRVRMARKRLAIARERDLTAFRKWMASPAPYADLARMRRSVARFREWILIERRKDAIV